MKKAYIVNRTFFVYAIVAVGITTFVDVRLWAWQYSQYLSWKYIYSDQKNYKNGVLYYDSITQWDPQNAEAYAGLGLCYYNLREYRKAINAYQKAIQLRPDFDPYRKDLVIIYETMRQK